MKNIIFVAGITATLLRGCLSSEEQFAADLTTAQQQCTAYGFLPGTTQFQQCLLYQTEVIKNDRAAKAEAIAAFGRSLQQAGSVQPTQMPVTCRTYNSIYGSRTTCM